MDIAVHGRVRNERSAGFIRELLPQLATCCDHLLVSKELDELARDSIPVNASIVPVESLAGRSPELFVSLGGDGTILECTALIGRRDIPILGINMGRLGYLSSAGHDDAMQALEFLKRKKYNLESRRLLQVEIDGQPFGEQNFALNEFAIHKSESASMITVHADVDGTFLNSYWADGLIIATPTGSTGYSLSCGGPIVAPESNNIILTPIAPHNLTVRPLVINDSVKLRLKADTNDEHFRISADSRSFIVDPATEMVISVADFTVKFVRFQDQDHFSTLREKLMWGHDRRN